MPAVTVILLARPQTSSEFARTALSISGQRLRDWELRVVHEDDPDLVVAAGALQETDPRVSGAADLAAALAGSSAPIVVFCETGARFPLDYLDAVVEAMSVPQVEVTVAARLVEHGPRFARQTRVEPDDAPVLSQLATRRPLANRPIEQLLSGPARRDLPGVAVRTRFGGPPRTEDGFTVIAEISEATPPLSVKPQLAALVEAGVPVLVTLVGPVRLPSRLALGKWLRESKVPAIAADSSAPARRAALTAVRTPVVTFLPAGWEVTAGTVAALAERLSSSGAAAVMPVARGAGGSILGAGLIWADRRSAPERLLHDHPYADIAGRVIEVPTPHPEGLTVRTEDVLDADLPAPWWPVVALRARRTGPFLVDGARDVSVPRFTPASASGKGRRGGRILPDQGLHQVLAAGRPDAVDQSRRVLDQLGYAVVGVEPSRSRWRPIVSRARTEPVAARRWALKIGAPPGQRGDPWGDVFFADDLAAALRSLGNDVIIDRDGSLGRTTAYLDRVVLNIRGYQVVPRQPGAVNLLWIISHPDDIPEEELRQFDRVYAASASWPKTAGRNPGAAIRPLLQATNPERFHPDVAEPDTGPDLLFVGNSRHQFRPIVADCRAAGLRPTVIGRDWEQFLPKDEIAALSVPNTDLPAAYRAAGIVLNDHWGDMVTHGFLNNRLFDAVACGARVVSDDVPGLAEVFGDAVAVYRTVEDLARLCDPANRALLGSEEQRRERAAAVASEHSFLARARQLMADAAQFPILPS